MILKKYNPTTPSRRFFTNVIFFDSLRLKKKQLKKKMALTKRGITRHGSKIMRFVRHFKKTPQLICSNLIPNNIWFIAQGYVYDKFNLKEFVCFKSAHNFEVTLPGFNTTYPGLKVYLNPTYSTCRELHSYLGVLLPIKNIPTYLEFSYLKNAQNTKWTYGLSPGTFCIKLKAEKKSKLLLVELPSKEHKFIVSEIMCILGNLTSNVLVNFVEGKCGSYLKKKRVSKVRGVAMNPVDHPNGGRTKSKNPQLTPWGWVAKCNR